MFNKEKILEIINQDGLFVDGFIFDAFIKNWKIDPIYEDENGIEYFDEMTIEKIKNGISQKAQSKYEIHIMDKDDVKPVDMAVEMPVDSPAEEFGVEVNKECADQNVICQEINVVEQCPQEEPLLPRDLPVEIQKNVEAELQNITVDISNQTLAVLAESIARKITADVSEFLKKSDFIEDAVHFGEIRQDNKILVEKMDEMLSDNKILVARIEELEEENNSYVRVFGNIFVKRI